MRIIYLNVYEGCKEEGRFEKIIEFVNKYKPDILGLSELNGWDENDFSKLKRFKEETGLKEHAFCKTRTGFNLGLFSNEKIENAESIIEGFRHGAISAKFTEITAILTHLSPKAEDFRLQEVEIIKKMARANDRVILIGDLNSLSPRDNYNEKILLEEMKKRKIDKFGKEKLRFDVIRSLENEGFIDSTRMFSKKFEYSVPSEYNKDPFHFTKLRLDYAFINQSLKDRIKNSVIINDEETNQLSDHFPIMIEIIDQ